MVFRSAALSRLALPFIDIDTISAQPFGGVQAPVGFRDQVPQALVFVSLDGDAKARGNRDLRMVWDRHMGQYQAKAFGDRLRVVPVAYRSQDDKLLAAMTGKTIAWAKGRLNAFRESA